MNSFNVKYLVLAVCLFIVEVIIAVFVRDTIVRPFIGDVLVVFLVYCAAKVFLNAAYWIVALGTLFFAFLIEILQYFDYVALLHLENNRVLSVMMGRTFEWMDFAAYFTGFVFILLIEKYMFRTRKIFQTYE